MFKILTIVLKSDFSFSDYASLISFLNLNLPNMVNDPRTSATPPYKFKHGSLAPF